MFPADRLQFPLDPDITSPESFHRNPGHANRIVPFGDRRLVSEDCFLVLLALFQKLAYLVLESFDIRQGFLAPLPLEPGLQDHSPVNLLVPQREGFSLSAFSWPISSPDFRHFVCRATVSEARVEWPPGMAFLSFLVRPRFLLSRESCWWCGWELLFPSGVCSR